MSKRDILFYDNGSLHSGHTPYVWDKKKVHTVPWGTEMILELNFQHISTKRWSIFKTDDGRRFMASPTEADDILKLMVLGRIKGLFGFVNKSTSQSITYLGPA